MTDLPKAVSHEPLLARSLEASLTVADIRASLRWYRDVMGFTIDREFEREGVLRAVSIRAGSVRLLLSQDTGARGAERVKGKGFSLQLTTPQDIDALAAGIVARGAAMDTPPSDMMGVRFFRLRDPDGFRFTISAPRD